MKGTQLVNVWDKRKPAIGCDWVMRNNYLEDIDGTDDIIPSTFLLMYRSYARFNNLRALTVQECLAHMTKGQAFLSPTD